MRLPLKNLLGFGYDDILHGACFSQGADNVVYERLADGNNNIKKVTREHLEQFGSAGLRTLCLAYKELHPDVYESWNEKFIQAKSSLNDREKKLDEVQFILLAWKLLCAYLASNSLYFLNRLP